MSKAPRYVPKEDIVDYDKPDKIIFKTTREYPLLVSKYEIDAELTGGITTFFIDEQEDEHFVSGEFLEEYFNKV